MKKKHGKWILLGAAVILVLVLAVFLFLRGKKKPDRKRRCRRVGRRRL